MLIGRVKFDATNIKACIISKSLSAHDSNGKGMITLVILLPCWLCFNSVLLYEAKEIHIDAVTSARYSSFVEHQSHYLDAPKHTVIRVSRFLDCSMKCLMAFPKCLSMNMASSSDGEKMFWCELLLDDKYNNSQNFRKNTTSHHYSKWTPCLNKPCQNGGLCVPLYHEDKHKCLCKTGFSGKQCETNVDDCSPSPCANGATCTDRVNNYTCTCAVGIYGRNCTIDPDDCASNPCVNGAACTDGLDDYTCSCPVGFVAKNCDVNPDECFPDPCVNGGTCTDGLNDYTCACSVGFFGKICNLTCADLNDGWTTFLSYCYKYISLANSMSDAKTYCANLDSYIVTIHSQAENDFVNSLIPADKESIWAGANDLATDGIWVWEDGKPWGDYTTWAHGEPNGGTSENCLMMFARDGLWNDAPCSGGRDFICKK